jgi:hypothetical protein
VYLADATVDPIHAEVATAGVVVGSDNVHGCVGDDDGS